MRDLDELRDEIDVIDKQLIELFEKRMDIAKEVADYKSAHHLAIFQKEREGSVLNKNLGRLKHEKYKDYARIFIQTLMDLSKAYQKAYLEEKK